MFVVVRSSGLTRHALVPAVAAGLLFSAACTPDRETVPVNEAERTAILGLFDQVETLRGLVVAPDRGGERLLAAVRTGPALRLLAPGEAAPMQLDDGLTGPDIDLSTCTAASAGAATFTGCEVGGHLIDGVVSSQGQRLDAELFDVFVYNEDSESAVAIDGALTRTRGMLRGSIAIDASWTAGSGEALFDAQAEFDDVVLDAAGCPLGGTLTLSGALVGAVAGPRSLSRSFAFGPECGDVVVLR